MKALDRKIIGLFLWSSYIAFSVAGVTYFIGAIDVIPGDHVQAFQFSVVLSLIFSFFISLFMMSLYGWSSSLGNIINLKKRGDF